MRRIGVLSGFEESDPQQHTNDAAFRQRLNELGWIDGLNVRIDYRWGAGDVERMQLFAKELVTLNPDVLVAITTPATAVLQKETKTIPIVFAVVSDPIGSGFVASLANPGGNITGLLLFETSIGGKWLAMLKEMAPHITRAAFVMNPKTAPYYEPYLRAGQTAASSLGIELVFSPIENDAAEIQRTVESFAGVSDGGLIIGPDTTNLERRNQIIALAADHQLPAIYSNRLFVIDGGLMAYSTDRAEHFRQAATYVDRILRGAKPTNLPVQAPTRYATTLNLKTAKALGLAVPPTLLATADEVIE